MDESIYKLSDLEGKILKTTSYYVRGQSSNLLDGLSKALMFKDFHHLSKFYNHYSKEYFPDELLLEEYQYDVTQLGFYFSEYILASEFNIDLESACILKNKIDHYYQPTGIMSYGNILFSDLRLVDQQLDKIVIQKEHGRLMFSYPLSFYASKRNLGFQMMGGDCINQSPFLLDDFSCISLPYFTNRISCETHIKKILDSILDKDSLVIPLKCFNHENDYRNWILQSIMDNYNCQIGYNLTYKDVLYLQKQDSQNRLLKRAEKQSNDDIHLNSIIEYLENIGLNIRELRKKKKIIQSKLAEDSNVSQKQIGNIERKKSNPSILTVRLILETLNGYNSQVN